MLSRTKRCIIWASIAATTLVGCSSSDSSSNASAEIAASADAACSRLMEYADNGVPATYVADAVELLTVTAEELSAAGLTDAADALLSKAIPALEGDFVTALQFKPIIREIHSAWCN